MKVLVACEFSGTVREAFRALGHDAWSCDLLPTERPSEFHLQCDARDVLDEGWDLLIAHPPCTYLTNAGARHLWAVPSRRGKTADVAGWERFEAMFSAADLFQAFADAPVARICIENPIPHHYARIYMGAYDQIIQPWQFGHGETKATCLWLKGLPQLRPTQIVEGREARVHRMSPSKDRWKERSRTYPGIAAAMAEQWGGW